MLETASVFHGIEIDHEKTIEQLNEAGYQSVFDIASTTKKEFRDHDFISEEEADKLYAEATQRVNNLLSLYKAYQLRNDPTIVNNPKLAITELPQSFKDAFSRSLGDYAGLKICFLSIQKMVMQR